MKTTPIKKFPRPALLHGTTRKMESPMGTLYIVINEDEEGSPVEVFVVAGKAGSTVMADAEAIGRLTSFALRYGLPVTGVIRQLRGISSDRAMTLPGDHRVLSMADAIAQALEMYGQPAHPPIQGPNELDT